MKRKCLIFFAIILFSEIGFAQSDDHKGSYYLRGVMEMASGIKLNEDSTFEFFYSYGALDRFGSGLWELKGDRIFLNSKTKHEKDFRLVKSGSKNNKDITIRFIDSNENILKYLHVALKRGEEYDDKVTDKDGLVHFEKKPFDSFIIMFEFFPEKRATFVPENSTYNYFEISLEPWISEVFFNHQEYKIVSDGLQGKHPLLVEKEYIFEKAD